MGFEPMTSCLLDRRSNQLSYGALHTSNLLFASDLIRYYPWKSHTNNRYPVNSPPSRLATSELATSELATKERSRHQRTRHQAKSSRHQPPIKTSLGGKYVGGEIVPWWRVSLVAR